MVNKPLKTNLACSYKHRRSHRSFNNVIALSSCLFYDGVSSVPVFTVLYVCVIPFCHFKSHLI